MSKFKRVATMGGQFYGIKFKCPGCGDNHVLCTQDTAPEVATGPRWNFNGDYDKPTLSPSILSRSGHYAQHFKPGDHCWCTHDAENPTDPSGYKCHICHSFVVEGRIQFLGDCTHALAGQTVELPEVES